MKNQINSFMEAKNIDVLLIVGPAQHNPLMTYFTGNVHVSDADLIIKRGEDPVLFCYPMEREEAAKTGLKTVSYNKYPLETMVKEAGGDFMAGLVLRYQRVFTDLGITRGRVAVYGQKDVGVWHSLLSKLQQALPGVTFEGFARDEILCMAMMTKDAKEIEHIRQMGKITVDVVGKTADFLTSHKTEKGLLVKSDGSPLLIKDVKRRINLWLAEQEAENPEGTIFAIGRDAGIPHSVGNPDDALRLGQTIVYDIFPCEAGGGYFYDFTRTWSLGYAPDPVLKLYEDVKNCYDTIYAALKVNTPFHHYQKQTCEFFESRGHKTIMSDPTVESGYNHSLGHGLGLQVHEKPWASMINPSPSDILAPGSVFTLEPGLYYPEKGMGVRIEDTLTVHPDGRFEILVDYSKDLILPIH